MSPTGFHPTARAVTIVTALVAALLGVITTPAVAAPVTGQVVTIGAVPPGAVLSAGAAAGNPATHIAGVDRYETSAKLSAHTFSRGVPVAYVATGTNFPDALAASAAAGAHKGPVLLTNPQSLPPSVSTELKRLAPNKVVVVGGADAVSDQVMNSIRNLGVKNVVRIGGPTRYETANMIATEAFPTGANTVYIATGTNFPDALAGGAVAAQKAGPVLLSEPNKLPAHTITEIRRLAPRNIVILGSSNAISASVERQIRNLGTSIVTRIGGPTRYETAAMTAATAGPNNQVFVATGANWPDAVVAAAAAGSVGAPVVLAGPDKLPEVSARQIANTIGRGTNVRTVQYIVSPHPDDEGSTWSLWYQNPNIYPVFIIMTHGESTSMCDGKGYEAGTGERKPSPDGFWGKGTPQCEAQRIDSWNWFLNQTAPGTVPSAQTVTGIATPLANVTPSRPKNGVRVPANTFQMAIGEDHARFVFDFGDGDVTPQEVTWAIQNVRRYAHRFGPVVENTAVSGYFNDHNHTDYYYVHKDHSAVFNALYNINQQLPGAQHAPISGRDPRAALRAELTHNQYCTLMCVGNNQIVTNPAQNLGLRRTGLFQQAYGWLDPGYWPAGETGIRGGFSRVQFFTSRF